MLKSKKILTGLHHSQYEHPFDKKALETLEATPGLTAAGRYVTSQTLERIYTVQYTGSHLRITKGSYPKIYDHTQYAFRVLEGACIPNINFGLVSSLNSDDSGVRAVYVDGEWIISFLF